MRDLQAELDFLNNSFADSHLRGCFEIQQENEIYFRYDTEDSTSKENWTTYCDITEELLQKGYTISDPYIEHDCITGTIVKA